MYNIIESKNIERRKGMVSFSADFKHSAKQIFINQYSIGFCLPMGVLLIHIVLGILANGQYTFHLKLLGLVIIAYLLSVTTLTVYKQGRRKGKW